MDKITRKSLEALDKDVKKEVTAYIMLADLYRRYGTKTVIVQGEPMAITEKGLQHLKKMEAKFGEIDWPSLDINLN